LQVSIQHNSKITLYVPELAEDAVSLSRAHAPIDPVLHDGDGDTDFERWRALSGSRLFLRRGASGVVVEFCATTADRSALLELQERSRLPAKPE
jgi:hypothetical protein